MLRRAAFSPNIKERADCSAALFTADGELLVQAEHIPVHLGSMPASVRGRHRRPRRPRSGPATRWSLNDPFAGGTHLNDVTLVAPCFVGRPAGRLGRQPGPPRRRGRHGARVDARRRHRDPPGGSAHPAGAAHAPRCEALLVRQLPHARRAARRPRRPGRRQRGRRRPAGRPSPARRSTRSSTTASAGCGPRSPPLPDGDVDVRGRARLAAAPAPTSSRPAHDRA